MAINPTPRRRGRQPGNVNGLKRERYSKRLPLKPSSPASPPTPEFQVAVARVRLAQLLDMQSKASKREWLSYERAIFQYLSLINKLVAATVHGEQERPDMAAILEYLRSQPPPGFQFLADHSSLIGRP
jgi:hypothetical protein